MAILQILKYPDPILHERSVEVDIGEPNTELPREVRLLVDDMFDTLADAEGLGLAAPQIGVLKRVIVVGVRRPFSMINPKILDKSSDELLRLEGCLSCPGVLKEISRPDTIIVEFTNYFGHLVNEIFGGLEATCIQHEIDHLDGILIQGD